MKVLLVNPPVKCSPGLNLGTQNRAQSFHIGLLYMAAVLEANGHTVEVLDCGAVRTGWEDLRLSLKKAGPDLVGITSTTPSFLNAVQTSKLVKEISPEIPVIMGGYHPTFFSREILERVPSVDMVSRGESEFTMMELANGHPREKIFGLSYRTSNGAVQTNPDRELIKDLDILPFPSRHLVNQYQYGSMGGIFQMAHPKRYTSLFTSRGCPYACRYCCVSAYSKRTFRTRSVENIEKEVIHLAKEGIDSIYIQDDNFAINQRLPMICEMLKSYKMKWFCLARVDMNPADLRRMAEAGCRGIYFGVESCSQKVLDYYRKRTTVEQVKTSIAKAKEAGMEVLVTLMVGAPVETWEDIFLNKNILTSLDIDALELNILTFFPYTDLWQEVDLERRAWDRELLVSEVFPERSVDEILEWCLFIKKSFYRRRRYIWRQLWRTLTRRRDLLFLNLVNIPKIVRYLKA
jgi:radical SAM superfamily enzyme YgiQ (UPF0313 family)